MTILDDAVARYNRILTTSAFRDLGWAKAIQEQMGSRHLMANGRPVCPVLRPHFVTRRQYESMAKAAETLYSAIDRVRQMALATPALLSRMELLPAEKMLASIDPGYPQMAVTSFLDTQLQNGNFQFYECDTDTSAGFVYADALTEIFYDAPPVKEFRKKHKLAKMGGLKKLLQSLLLVYKGAGKKKFPRIAIVEFRPPFKNSPAPEHMLMAEYFRQHGYPTEVVTPDQLEYRNGVLSRGDFGIEIVIRKVSAQEFLFRFDLMHPLVRAYREKTVCMVNSFRAEIVQKRSLLSLLTDEMIAGSFPAAERKAIREHIPWTRLVMPGKTTRNGKTVDLLEYIQKHREKLVLRPNDTVTDMNSFRGWETDDAGWEKAIKTAQRSPYVVQERVDLPRAPFPVYQFGKMEVREMEIEVHPHLYLGHVDGCSTEIHDATTNFSTLSGLAPTFLLV